jgi:hypothetical protein
MMGTVTLWGGPRDGEVIGADVSLGSVQIAREIVTRDPEDPDAAPEVSHVVDTYEVVPRVVGQSPGYWAVAPGYRPLYQRVPGIQPGPVNN